MPERDGRLIVRKLTRPLMSVAAVVLVTGGVTLAGTGSAQADFNDCIEVLQDNNATHAGSVCINAASGAYDFEKCVDVMHNQLGVREAVAAKACAAAAK
ncbi:hypothetical protein [Streptomyces mayteni]